MILKNYTDFINESITRPWIYEDELTSLEGAPKNFSSAFKYSLYHLMYESSFIEAGSYKNDYWPDLLMYMTKEKINLEEVKGWPEGFLNSNLVKSAKGIVKFNL